MEIGISGEIGSEERSSPTREDEPVESLAPAPEGVGL